MILHIQNHATVSLYDTKAVSPDVPLLQSGIEMIPLCTLGWDETSVRDAGNLPCQRQEVLIYIPGSGRPVPRWLEESKETSVSWHTTLLAKSSVLYLCEGDEGGRRDSAVPRT